MGGVSKVKKLIKESEAKVVALEVALKAEKDFLERLKGEGKKADGK